MVRNLTLDTFEGLIAGVLSKSTHITLDQPSVNKHQRFMIICECYPAPVQASAVQIMVNAIRQAKPITHCHKLFYPLLT